MTLHFLHAPPALEAHAAEAMGGFLHVVFADMGLGSDELEETFVADDAHFGAAVRLAGGETYTNADGLVAGAKVISRAEGDTLRHTLVVHLHVLAAAFVRWREGVALEAWTPLEQLCFYVLHHECGHVLDRRARPALAEVPICREGRGFEVGQVARYYGHILEEEYAASVPSALWMSPAVYLGEVETFRERVGYAVRVGEEWKERVRREPGRLGELAFTVAGQCWFLLIQFAKLAALRAGNPILAALAVEHWPAEGAGDAAAVGELLTEFEGELAAHWRSYPHWSADPPAFLRETWSALALELGFVFREDERGSAVFW